MPTIAVLVAVGIVVIAVIDLIISRLKNDGSRWKQTINPCIACGSAGYVDGAFCETHVRCANHQCSMTGPNGEDEPSAIKKWNDLKRISKGKQKNAKGDQLTCQN